MMSDHCIGIAWWCKYATEAWGNKHGYVDAMNESTIETFFLLTLISHFRVFTTITDAWTREYGNAFSFWNRCVGVIQSIYFDFDEASPFGWFSIAFMLGHALDMGRLDSPDNQQLLILQSEGDEIIHSSIASAAKSHSSSRDSSKDLNNDDQNWVCY